MIFGTREEYEKYISLNELKDLWKWNCPFCWKKNAEYIIWTWRYWSICHNKYPYLWLTNHLMAIPHRHVIKSSELSKEEYWELQEISSFMENYYKWENYFSFLRETNGGRSLEHLHYHFLPGVIYSTALEEMLKNQWF